MWQKGKKGERDRHELCERAGSCAQHHPGQGSNPHCASRTKAVPLSPRDGQEGWTCVTQCEHGAGQREGQHVCTVDCEVTSHPINSSVPPWAATSPLSPSLTLEISVLPCTSKHKSRYAWGVLQKCRGRSSPRSWPSPLCQTPSQMLV